MLKKHLTCPRCRSTTTGVRAHSSEKDVWTMFGCDTCFYTWRSTEPVENTDPDHYSEIFRLSPKDIPGLPIVPVIPALRKES